MSDTLIKQLLSMAKIEKGLTAELLEQSAQELSAALARIEELERALNDLLNDCINFDGGKLTDLIMKQASDVLSNS